MPIIPHSCFLFPVTMINSKKYWNGYFFVFSFFPFSYVSHLSSH